MSKTATSFLNTSKDIKKSVNFPSNKENRSRKYL